MAGDCADNPSRQQTDGGEPTNRYLDAIDAMPTQDPSALRPVLLLRLQMPHEAEPLQAVVAYHKCRQLEAKASFPKKWHMVVELSTPSGGAAAAP